ncbi:hypothetical protein ACS0TY_020849 [Phlomoides rotata]
MKMSVAFPAVIQNMKMSVPLSLLLLLSLSLAIHTTDAFNITAMLEKYPDYSTFNSYLTQANLVSEINSRQTITVLAVDNSNISPLAGKPLPVLKNIISVHVILDYYDVAKLQKLSKNSVLLTTLFQSSGLAQNHQGFINVTKLGSDSIAMGSAAPGAPLGSNLVKSIVSQPYNISVLQVSHIIVPPGIDGSRSTAPQSSPPAPPTPTPKSGRAPTPSTTKSVAPALAPIVDDLADGPDLADAPNEDKADAPSGASALHVSLAVVVTMVLSTLYLASRI